MSMNKRNLSAIAKELEKKAENSRTQKYLLRLYVAGMTSQSSRAIQNITRLCEENFCSLRLSTSDPRVR